MAGSTTPAMERLVQALARLPGVGEKTAARLAFFILRSDAEYATELAEAIRTVLAGSTYINPTLGAKLAAEPPVPGPPDGLTPRELEVLSLLAQGYMNPEIAEQLVLSVRTVETHRANIQRKTGAGTRAELVAYAREHEID